MGLRAYRAPAPSAARSIAAAMQGRSACVPRPARSQGCRSEEQTSELQSLMRISYAVFCLKNKKKNKTQNQMSNHKLIKSSVTIYVVVTKQNTHSRQDTKSYES